MKLSIKNTKIVASGPITSWQVEGGKSGSSDRFYVLGLQITAEVTAAMKKKKRYMFHGRKAMTNLDSVLKSGDITLLTKVQIVKATVFPVVMYAYESWTIKKAECCRTDAFKLWWWKRLLRVPWTARRSNQSILKELTLNIHWRD